jgi:hypothetical protein
MTSYAAGGVQGKPQFSITREAKRDLSDYQYHAVMIDTDGLVDYADISAGDKAIGVLQNAPDAAGKEAEIAVLGTSIMVVDGNGTNINEGDPISSNSNYHGIKADADGEGYIATALEPSTADGDGIEVLLAGGHFNLYVAP